MGKQVPAGNKQKSLLKLIDKYYADLAELARQHVMFEMGTRHAFHRLMADAGKPHRWTLIAEQEKKVNGKTIRPDGNRDDDPEYIVRLVGQVIRVSLETVAIVNQLPAYAADNT